MGALHRSATLGYLGRLARFVLLSQSTSLARSCYVGHSVVLARFLFLGHLRSAARLGLMDYLSGYGSLYGYGSLADIWLAWRIGFTRSVWLASSPHTRPPEFLRRVAALVSEIGMDIGIAHRQSLQYTPCLPQMRQPNFCHVAHRGMVAV